MGDVENLFTKKFSLFFELAKTFDIAVDAAHPVASPLDLPLIAGDLEILLGIYLQNVLQPKNAQRRDAVTNGTYVNIITHDHAVHYLTERLQDNMRIRA